MSKVKDGFTNHREAHDVRHRDLEALAKMKELELRFKDVTRCETIGGMKITTTSDDSRLINYAKEQHNEFERISKRRNENSSLQRLVQERVSRNAVM